MNSKRPFWSDADAACPGQGEPHFGKARWEDQEEQPDIQEPFRLVKGQKTKLKLTCGC